MKREFSHEDKHFFIPNVSFIRRPLYNFKDFLKIPEKEDDLNDFIKFLYNDSTFKEAILIASYELYQTWFEQINLNKIFNKNKINKLNYTLIKYFIRISTRCTPFGLFSTSSVFDIKNSDDSEKFYIPNVRNVNRYSFIDLSFIFQIINEICKKIEFRSFHKYIINKTIYKIGNEFRYIETLSKNNEREYILSSIEIDEVLELLYNNIKEPLSTKDLSSFLANYLEEISIKDIQNYIEQLIDNQFLVNEIDICLNEKNPLIQLIESLRKLHENSNSIELNNIILRLEKIKQKINELDKNIGNNDKLYQEIFSLADKFEIEYNKNQLINVNIQENIKHSFLQKEDLQTITKVVRIITKFMNSNDKSIKQTNLNKFKEIFYKRYEEQEIPLVEALDNETGIGYIQNEVGSHDFSELIDDLVFTDKNNFNQEFNYNSKIHKLWNDLILEAYSKNSSIIDLKKIDLSNFNENIDLLSNYFCVLLEKSNELTYISSIEQHSSLDYIARFTNENISLDKCIESIKKHEETDKDVIHAELLHLPNYRAGNIMLRKIERKYEVTYLSKSSKKSYQIPINDLYLKIFNEKLIIISKSLKKEVKIYNTNAHNYHYNSLPIYQFLCDLQHQNTISCSINLGFININTFNFLPRITYGEKIVLSPASWRITKKEIKSYIYDENNSPITNYLLYKKKISRYIYIGEGDNKLLIDIKNKILLNILINEIKKNEHLILTECLYDPTKDEKSNEIIVPIFRKNLKKSKNNIKNINSHNIQRKFIPADNWLFYKIYAGTNTLNKILLELVEPFIYTLKKKKLIKNWFFIRFSDPEPHLRIRLEISDNKNEKNISQIISIFNLKFKKHVYNSSIWKIELSTYNREIERYQGELILFSEKVFYYDSEMVIKLLKNKSKNTIWLYSIKCIDTYLNIFCTNIEEKLQIIDQLYKSFLEEFKADKNLKKQIDLKYRNNINLIENIINHQILPETEDIINEFSTNIINYIKNNKLKQRKIINLIDSFIHMNINRLIRSNQRLHELVIYGLLSKYYRMNIGALKFKP